MSTLLWRTARTTVELNFALIYCVKNAVDICVPKYWAKEIETHTQREREREREGTCWARESLTLRTKASRYCEHGGNTSMLLACNTPDVVSGEVFRGRCFGRARVWVRQRSRSERSWTVSSSLGGDPSNSSKKSEKKLQNHSLSENTPNYH